MSSSKGMKMGLLDDRPPEKTPETRGKRSAGPIDRDEDDEYILLCEG